LIVFDASAVVSAVLGEDRVPERALLRALATDNLALSVETDEEIAAVLERPRIARLVSPARRFRVLAMVRRDAVWFTPAERVPTAATRRTTSTSNSRSPPAHPRSSAAMPTCSS
jgi:predicted nucleic acid-binding protein